MSGKERIVWVSVVLAVLCLFKPCAVAAEKFVIAPVGATASTSYPTPPWGLPVSMINGSGLTMTGTIWTATHTNASVENLFWHSNTGIVVKDQWVEFDLGAPYDLSSALLWQLSQKDNTARGIQEFSMSVAAPDHRLAVISRDFKLNLATNDASESVQVFPLVAKNVQFIRINIWSNWGADGIVGLSEVRFEVSTPVPPPTTLIILPMSVTASSYYDYQGHYEPQWLSDNSGLTGAGKAATHSNANGWDLFWHSDGNGVANQWLEFDLGAEYAITNALIWQLAQAGLTTRGVNSFSLEVAGSDHTFTSYSTGNTLTQATGAPQEPVQVVPLFADNIRYIKLLIHSNFGNQYVGLSEVQFEVAPPELNTTDVTVAPDGASASTWVFSQNGPSLDGAYAPQLTIDGSGLTGTGRAATHSNANAQYLLWHSALNVTTSDQWIEFDLGRPYDLKNLLIWQAAIEGLTQYGLKEFAIEVAGESDHLFTTYSTGNVLNRGSTGLQQFARVIPLVAANIRYVRLDIQSNWGAANGVVALSEVRFEVAPTVPMANTFIRSPAAIEVSSFYGDNPSEHLIDGSGLNGIGLDATHTNGIGFTSMWLSGDTLGVGNEWVAFDLGGEFALVGTAIWQYNQTETGLGDPADYTYRGVKMMKIFTAGSDENYTEYGTFQLNRAQRYDTEPAQIFNLRARGVRYVKFAVNSTWGGGTDDKRVGLSEVQFLYKRTSTIISLR